MKSLFLNRLTRTLQAHEVSEVEILLSEIANLTSPEREEAFVKGVLEVERSKRLAA